MQCLLNNSDLYLSFGHPELIIYCDTLRQRPIQVKINTSESDYKSLLWYSYSSQSHRLFRIIIIDFHSDIVIIIIIINHRGGDQSTSQSILNPITHLFPGQLKQPGLVRTM